MQKSFNNYAFIDTSNVQFGIQYLGWELDWRKFLIFLKEKYEVDKAYLFLGYLSEQKDYYDYLKGCGYELIFKEARRKGNIVKGNIDMELAVQVMKDYKNFEKAVLVTNDGDFAVLVDYLQHRKKFGMVISPNIYRCARLLKKAAGNKWQTITFSRAFLELHKKEPYSIRTEPESTTAQGKLTVSQPLPEDKLSFFDPISTALADLRSGKMVIVVDSEKRENEGDLVMAAEFCKPNDVNFMISHAKGLVCVPMDLNRAMKLSLPLMVRKNEEKTHCKFTVSCDVKMGITTGISTNDRAKTIQALADDLCVEQDFVSPGHVFPIIADPEGLAGRQGHTEATLELLKCAGLKSVGVICEIIREDGEMMRREDLFRFKTQHGLKLISIESLIRSVE